MKHLNVGRGACGSMTESMAHYRQEATANMKEAKNLDVSTTEFDALVRRMPLHLRGAVEICHHFGDDERARAIVTAYYQSRSTRKTDALQDLLMIYRTSGNPVNDAMHSFGLTQSACNDLLEQLHIIACRLVGETPNQVSKRHPPQGSMGVPNLHCARKK